MTSGSIWALVLDVLWQAAIIILGFVSLFANNAVLPYLYLVCGLLSAAVLNRRMVLPGVNYPDKVCWLIFLALPAPFLVYYLEWLWLTVYLLIAGGWIIYRKRFSPFRF